jgi:nucleotide-binding universal stress UspA family protein
MASTETASQIALKNILYLTDFSPASEAALPLLSSIAADHESKVFVLHVLLPDPYVCMAPECAVVINEGQEQAAKASMQQLEAHLAGLMHQTAIIRGTELWPAVESVMQKNNIDLLVLGTLGRTGVQKLLMGSVTEEIWRRSNVPVLTVGPETRNVLTGGRFKCVLFATDFTPEAQAAFPYAIAMARETHAHLILLHVVRQFKKEEILGDQAAFDSLHQMDNILPDDMDFWCVPELIVKHGRPAERILEVAGKSCADLIVLGVRKGDDFGIATHADRATAHNVVVNAACPVLTVRG